MSAILKELEIHFLPITVVKLWIVWKPSGNSFKANILQRKIVQNLSTFNFYYNLQTTSVNG